mgnify:CR=1 FL=1|tara:strand:+ start:148 stop:531 length:384 start_codon:yes stop_codon:yes gene_type:complete
MSEQMDLVKELIDAFNSIDMERILACFTEDAEYHNIPMEKVNGVEAIRQVLTGLMGSATAVKWDLLHIAEGDGIVLTERVDKFELNGKWIALPVMGVFEISNSRISAWRDYFDLNDFQSQFAAATSS